MINTREIAEELRLSHWAQIMKDRRNSGLSIKKFCKSAGFHENVYYYWQRRVRTAVCEVLPDKTPGLMSNPLSTEDKHSLVPNGWAVCEAAAPVQEEAVLPIEINGCRVMASADTDLQLLSKVCKVLVNLC